MNNDLISRKWLLENHKSHMGFLGVRKLIQEAPAVDAVEVVRCSDCKYHWFSQTFGYYLCDKSHRNLFVEPNDFCSYGERREECETD